MEYNKKEIRDKYSELFENSLILFYVHDLKGNFLDANEIALSTLGYDEKDIPNLSFKDLLEGDQLLRSKNRLEEILGGSTSSNVTEHKLKTKDGKFVYVETYGIPLKKDGEIYAILGIANNITERKIAEQKLKESEVELTSLLENSPDFILTVDRNNKIQYINHIPQDFIKEPVIGGNFYECLMPENQEMYKYSFKKVFETGIPLTIDVPGFADAWYTTRFIPIKRGGDTDSVMLIITNITDIKEAEKKIKDSEEKYRLISENANDMITIVNLNLKIEYINEKVYKQLMGYSKEDLINKSILKLIHPDDIEIVAEVIKEGIEVGEGTMEGTMEVRIQNKKGNYIWLEGRGTTFRDKDGEFKGLFITRDITERKRAEQRLKESEEKYRNMINNLDLGFFKADVNGVFLNHNPALSKILGYAPSVSLIGLKASDIWENPEDLKNFFNKIVKEGSLRNFVHRAKKKNGEIIFLQVDSHLIRNEENKIIEIEGTAFDVTERFILEQKLRESEKTHRTLVETSPNSIVLLDNRGIIVDCNKKTEILLDLDKKEIIGKNFIDLYTIKKEKIPSLIEIFERIKKGLIPHPIEFEYLNKKGKKILVESYTSLVKMENEMLIQVVSQDITDRKVAEQNLKESEKMYRLIMENAYDLIAVLNDKFKYEYINEQVHNKILGYSSEDLIGKSALRKVHPEDIRSAIKKWQAGVSIGNETIELRYKKKDGTYIWLEIRGKRYRDHDGLFKGIIISRDITDRKKLED